MWVFFDASSSLNHKNHLLPAGSRPPARRGGLLAPQKGAWRPSEASPVPACRSTFGLAHSIHIHVGVHNCRLGDNSRPHRHFSTEPKTAPSLRPRHAPVRDVCDLSTKPRRPSAAARQLFERRGLSQILVDAVRRFLFLPISSTQIVIQGVGYLCYVCLTDAESIDPSSSVAIPAENGQLGFVLATTKRRLPKHWRSSAFDPALNL